MCQPENVKEWPATEAQRAAYVNLLGSILGRFGRHAGDEKWQLLREKRLQVKTSEAVLDFLNGQLRPKVEALRQAYKHLDPDLYVLNDFDDDRFFNPCGIRGRVRATFEKGLHQVADLIEDNPGQELEFHLFPDRAYEVVDSKLIDFDPDKWLDRAGNLAPIRTERGIEHLPIHVRLRLEDLFRTYVFGCWLAVPALARAILEYAILDNLHKFEIERCWPPDRRGNTREKTLEHLIRDVAERTPELEAQMNAVRDYGNDFMHPKRTRTSKETLFQREERAKEAIDAVTSVVESLYRYSAG